MTQEDSSKRRAVKTRKKQTERPPLVGPDNGPSGLRNTRMVGRYTSATADGSDKCLQAYFWQKVLHEVPDLASALREAFEAQIQAHGRAAAVNIPPGQPGAGEVWPDLRATIDGILARWNINGDGFQDRAIQHMWQGCPDVPSPDPIDLDRYAPLLVALPNWPGPDIEIAPIPAFNPTAWWDSQDFIDVEIKAITMQLERHCQEMLAKFKANPSYQERPTKQEVKRHTDWLIRYQVRGERMKLIAVDAGVSTSDVSKFVKAMAAMISLPLREPDTGRIPGSKNAHGLGLRRHKAPGK